ncbi:MAG: amino acid ABC transporter permease [Desulfobacteraceae bacterium]|nr:amino acid ABC transporter permease [Desulfobacteraceae bacterium]
MQTLVGLLADWTDELYLTELKKNWSNRNSFAVWNIAKFVVVVAFLCWMLFRGTERLGYHWQWYRLPQYFLTFDANSFITGPLLNGVIITLKITGISLIFAFGVGLTTAFLRLSNSYIGRFIARAYLELVRNTPLLVQLFFIYFVIAPVLDIDRFTAAVLALSLFEGAYASEIFRAGIVSIYRGQWEAAHSLGLSTFYIYRHVILPQAIRRVLPPLTSQAISLVKDSALVSTIAIYDLSMHAQAIVAETYLVFEIWFAVALIYLVITVSISFAVNVMEHRLRIEE